MVYDNLQEERSGLNDADRFVKEFRNNFAFLLKKRVVIYGIGVNTALILERIPEMNVVGLLDRNKDNIGKDVCGKRVITVEQAMEADAIIIVTLDPCYWEIIYRRISDICEKKCVPVYYTDGTRAERKVLSEDISKNTYWSVTSERIEATIDNVEVVSFDIFDTLIMRRVYYPATIFYLVELQYIQRFHKQIQLAETRKVAESNLVKMGNSTPTYDQIYDYVKEGLRLSDDEIEFVKKKEIELEEKLVLPRKDVVRLLEYAETHGKEVYLISDMYFDKVQIEKLLHACGINGNYEIIVSSEEKAKKSDGLLWNKYKKKICNKSALHIGDNDLADIVNAEKAGITVQKIYSARELLENSSIRDIVSDICSPAEEVVAGVLISKIFNSPFALSKSKGIVEWNSHEDLGYAVYAAPVYNYLVWLMKNAHQKQNDQILFFARDGYVLQKMYSYIIDKYELEDMPVGVYFAISRMFGVLLSIYDKEDIEAVLKSRYVGRFSDFMKNRFFVSVEEDAHKEEAIYTDVEFEKVMSYIEPYVEKILETARQQRLRYGQYIDAINLKNFCISDPSYQGTNQYYLSQFLKKKFDGYYMYADLNPMENPYQQTEYMKALYQTEEDTLAELSCLNRNSTQFENGILVAPEGGLIGIDEDGNFIRTPEGYTQKHFDYKETMMLGVKKYIDDISLCYKGLEIENIPHVGIFVDRLFGEMIGYKCKISKDIKDTFYVDTFYGTVFDRKMWE